MLVPRPYQAEARNECRARWRAGSRAILLVGPTGMGKTALSVMLGAPALNSGKRVGFFVHREELLEQARAAFGSLGIEAGIIKGDAPASRAKFQLVSIQTAARRRLELDFDLAFLDEAHHFMAKEWVIPIRSMRARGVPIIGLTATPDRGDGVGVGGPDGIFDSMIVVAQPRQLIKLGYLVPVRVIGPMTARKSLAAHPVEAFFRYARNRRTIVFCGTVAYARKLAGEFQARGVRAACVDGKLDDIARAKAIAAFRSGELEVLTSVQVLTEGFDAPETSCVILTTGAASPGPLIQKVGRGMRPAPGKVDCLVLDLKAACRDLCMLPDDDREFSLEGKAIRAGASDRAMAIVQCKACGLWFRAEEFVDSTCPECGAVRKGKQDPVVRRAIMAAMSATMPQEERVSWLAKKILEGSTMRKKDGTPYKAVKWAIQQYAARFKAGGGRSGFPTTETINAALLLANEIAEKRRAKAAEQAAAASAAVVAKPKQQELFA